MNRYKIKTNCISKNDLRNVSIETAKRFVAVFLLLIVVSIYSSGQSTLCPLSFKAGGGSYVNSMTINGQTVPGYTPEGSVNSYPTYIDNSNTNSGRLVKGMTYSLSINVNSGAFNYCFVKLWIDFDGSNNVNALNEIVFLDNSQFQGGHIFTGNITIPSNVTIGEKYMRVITTMVNPTQECGNWEPYQWGQAIDYTVTIANPSIIPSSLSVCQGLISILTLSTQPGTAPYTFTYTINDGVNQTVSTYGNNTSVDLSVNTYGAGTFTYKLISIKDAADNDLPLNGTTSVVTVKPIPPKPTITGSSTICPGTTVQLSSSSATNNHWSTGATSQTISVTQPGYYYVEVTNLEGCTNSSDTYTLGEITYFESPVVTEGNFKNLCLGSSTTINVTGASGYTWSPAIGLNTTTGASVIANPTATTVYTITSASAGNCSTSVTVNVLNPPVSITTNGPVVFCEGDSVKLSAKPDAGLSFALNGVSNAVTTPNLVQAFPTFPSSVTIEVWFKADRQGVIVTELGPNQLGNIGINKGWHDSQIEMLADGKVKVRVWDLPAIELGIVPFSTWQHVVLRYNAATQTLDGFLNNMKSASSVQGIRSVPSGQFWAFGATDNQNLGSGEYFSGQMDEIRIWNVARTDAQILDNYKIPVPENSQGLVVYYKFDEVNDFTAEDASINNFNGAIWNTSFTDATPQRPASTVPLDYSSYLWSTGATTPDIRVKTTGNYSVTIPGSEGCLSTVSQQVTVKTKLVPADSVVTICLGDSASLSITGVGNYSWFPATGLSATTGSSVKASPTETTTYTITSTDPNVCSTIIRVNV
ncbi:MAG: LamG-like jellyroll fold domain-containing protein, partial [Bacteroidota bacterium]